jgi:protein-S-isoprenylcysteine O-methyltransferase Ste14
MGQDLFFASAIVCLITHIIRLVYEILKHRGIIKASKVSFVIMFTNMILLWVSWFILCSSDIFMISLPAIIRYLGLLLSCLGLVAFITGLLTIKTLESYDGDLITSGIYSKIRHPMYLGFILWLIGFPLFFGAPFALLLALLFIMNILFWRQLEEAGLEKRFPTYSEYKKTTWF